MGDSISGKSCLFSAPLDGVSKTASLNVLLETQRPMKKFLLATVAFVALGATAPALAADLAARPAYTKAPAIMAPIYNWTGFYIGGHVGAAFGNDNAFNGLVVGNNNDAR